MALLTIRAASIAASFSLLALPASATSLQDQVNQALGVSAADVQELVIDGSTATAVFTDIVLAGTSYHLELYPHSVRSDDYQVLEQREDGRYVQVRPAPERTLRGYLADWPGSRVAASWLDDGLYARILADGQEWWVQPIAKLVPDAAPTQHAVYSQSAVLNHPGHCGADSLPNNQRIADPVTPGGGANTYGTIKVCELACDTDHEYYLDYGSTAAVTNRINTVINTMNLQYESEVGITHEIGTIIVRSSTNDPYSSNDAGTLLDQFRSHWVNNQSGVHRDVAHMFTGRNINGGTIGIAWLGVICNSSYGYGLVESDFNNNFSSATDLSAHELGHNWNADHCNCTSNTMNPYITSANTFHVTLTRPEIVSHRNSRSCLSDQTGGGNEVQLFADGFESGDFATGGWVLQNNRPRIRPRAARTGSWGARIRRAAWIERSVSTSGYTNIRLEYSRRTRNLDPGETFKIEFFDGLVWNTVETVGDTGNSWSDKNITLNTLADNNPSFKIRFTIAASQGKERGDLDDVRVFGTQ